MGELGDLNLQILILSRKTKCLITLTLTLTHEQAGNIGFPHSKAQLHEEWELYSVNALCEGFLFVATKLLFLLAHPMAHSLFCPKFSTLAMLSNTLKHLQNIVMDQKMTWKATCVL